MPDVAQDRGHRGGARIDIGVDVQGPHQRGERGIIDQRDGHGAPGLLGAHGHQQVGLVIIRHGQHGIGAVDGGLHQDVHVHPVAVQHDGPFQTVRRLFRPRAVLLDDPGAHAVCPRLQRACHGQTHIAAADDDDALLLLGLLAEDVQGAIHVFGMGQDVNLILGKELVRRIGGEQPPAPPHADHNGAQGRKEVIQLPQGRVQHRAIGVQLDAQKLCLAGEEGFRVKGGRRGKPLQRRLGHLPLGADHNVDGQVIPAIKVGIDRIQIALRPEPRDLARDGEDGMGHLAGDHVHLVGMGGRDDHVGIARPGLFQHIRVRGEADDALHIQHIGGPADQIGVLVHQRDVVPLAGKLAGDLPPDLPRAADDDLHGALRLCLTAQGVADGEDWRKGVG